jgi:hypothetical protein
VIHVFEILCPYLPANPQDIGGWSDGQIDPRVKVDLFLGVLKLLGIRSGFWAGGENMLVKDEVAVNPVSQFPRKREKNSLRVSLNRHLEAEALRKLQEQDLILLEDLPACMKRRVSRLGVAEIIFICKH